MAKTCFGTREPLDNIVPSTLVYFYPSVVMHLLVVHCDPRAAYRIIELPGQGVPRSPTTRPLTGVTRRTRGGAVGGLKKPARQRGKNRFTCSRVLFACFTPSKHRVKEKRMCVSNDFAAQTKGKLSSQPQHHSTAHAKDATATSHWSPSFGSTRLARRERAYGYR